MRERRRLEREGAREERLQRAWEGSQLVRLAAWAGMRRPDSPFYADPRFADWLDGDLRGRDGESAAEGGGGRAHRWAPAQLERAAERLHAAAAAARLGVRTSDGPPEERVPGVRGTVGRVMEEADAARSAPRVTQAIAAGAGRELWDEECESWVPLPPGVPPGRFVALTVAGESMLPLFHPGDVVLVKLGPVAARDSVIVARLPDDGYVVKRVGRVTRRTVELLSLNPAFPALTVAREPGAVVGTVVLRWCDHAVGRRG